MKIILDNHGRGHSSSVAIFPQRNLTNTMTRATISLAMSDVESTSIGPLSVFRSFCRRLRVTNERSFERRPRENPDPGSIRAFVLPLWINLLCMTSPHRPYEAPHPSSSFLRFLFSIVGSSSRTPFLPTSMVDPMKGVLPVLYWRRELLGQERTGGKGGGVFLRWLQCTLVAARRVVRFSMKCFRALLFLLGAPSVAAVVVRVF